MADKAKRAALIGYDCLIPKRLEAMLAQGGLYGTLWAGQQALEQVGKEAGA